MLRMKKMLCCLISLGLLCTLASCGGGSSTAESSNTSAATEEQTTAESSTADSAAADSAAESGAESSETADSASETSADESSAAPVQADSLTTNGGAVIALSSLEHCSADAAPEVFYIADISADAMVQVYDAMNWTPEGRVAVKISTGESAESNYLRPELIGELVQQVSGTIVECNTAYGGSRSDTASHYQITEDRGFTAIADVQILDENGSMTLPVDGTVLSEDYVGAAFADYDSYLVLSHFKGHAMAGFGGAIKNISIGLASSEGKSFIHSGGNSTSSMMGDQNAFLEAMGDAGKAVSDYLGNGARIAYVNVMNRLSVDCDCDASPAEPDMHDVGILASTDPVALDQACIDLVYASDSDESASLRERIESRNGLHTLENAEAIGLGSRQYHLTILEG